MNFIKLNDLSNHFSEDYLTAFDTYLSGITRNCADRLTINGVATYLKTDYCVAEDLIKKSCELGILTERYALHCPECEMTLKLVDSDELEDAVAETNYCYDCGFGEEQFDLVVSNEDITNIYKINK